MNTEQPLAIALAERLDAPSGAPLFVDAAAELRRLHQSERESWRYSDELEQERKRLTAENEALRQQLKQQEPSAGGIIFAVEQAIQNGDCPWEIESAFDEYESERIALARAGEVK